MLFRETVAVFCENHMKQLHFVGSIQSSSVLKSEVCKVKVGGM
jgi:hypothetical protein